MRTYKTVEKEVIVKSKGRRKRKGDEKGKEMVVKRGQNKKMNYKKGKGIGIAVAVSWSNGKSGG